LFYIIIPANTRKDLLPVFSMKIVLQVQIFAVFKDESMTTQDEEYDYNHVFIYIRVIKLHTM